jgi:predicted nucleic acid-binding protein
MTVVVDTSLVIKWISDESDSSLADDLFATWQLADVDRVAPALSLAEISNVLLKHVADGVLTLEDAVAKFPGLPRLVTFIEMTPSHARRAITLADAVHSRAVDDFFLVALAEELKSDLWTADVQFWRSARAVFPFVKLLGHDVI